MNDNLKFSGMYRAKVIDNLDSEQVGRVKVEVYPMLIGKVTAKNLDGVDGIETEQLPWAVPAAPLFTGAGDGYGSFMVPDIDSYVFVFFEEEDINQPVYFAEAPTKLHGLPSERTTNYPNRRIVKTSNGVVFYIDDSTQEVRMNHPSGAYLIIDGSGNITISGTSIRLNP